MQKLARRDLSLADAALVAKVGDCTIGQADLEDAPDPVRDFACLKDLDREIRSGGFAQYFFSFSAKYAFDVWLASQETTDEFYDLVTRAIARVTFEFGDLLDLHAIFEESDGKAMPDAYKRYIATIVKAQAPGGDRGQTFSDFRDRVNRRFGAWDGLEGLTMEYYAKIDMNALLAKIVRDNADCFVES
jgi:hypothetical protein